MKTSWAAAVGLFLAPFAGAEVTHQVAPTEHLWGLAQRYYKNPYRWRVIADANAAKVKDPHWIYPGQVLVIPDLKEPEVPKPAPTPEPPVAAAPQPEEPAEEAPAPEPAPAPAPEPPVRRARATPLVSPDDDLSTEMPEGQTDFSSEHRLTVEHGWKADGRVTEFDGREAMTAAGDTVYGTIEGKTSKGDRFIVLRKDSARELDGDEDSVYLDEIGIVELRRDLGRSAYAFHILKSVGPVAVGDYLQKAQ